MAWLRTEEEAEKMIEEMKKKNKGKYITQGVTFNKESVRQMELLKFALMYAPSFSGLGKELIADRLDGTPPQNTSGSPFQQLEDHVEKRNVSNFV